MAAPGPKSDTETKEYQFSASSHVDGGFSGAAIFYQADLDKVQRKLSGVHIQMYVRSPCSVLTFYGSLAIRFAVRACSLYLETPDFNVPQIAGVIGTGLFLGLGQLLATTGPLGVLLVFLLVGSVAFAFVNLAIFVCALMSVAVLCSSIVSVTEMAVFAPVSGSFSHYGKSTSEHLSCSTAKSAFC